MMERIAISLEKKLLDQFDRLMAGKGYSNRSEAVRDLIREKLVERGTGSEHTGVVLITDEGKELTLVRLGGNPFRDEATRALIGKVIEAEGYLIGDEVRYTSVKAEK